VLLDFLIEEHQVSQRKACAPEEPKDSLLAWN
jgi:hypothetical protein